MLQIGSCEGFRCDARARLILFIDCMDVKHRLCRRCYDKYSGKIIDDEEELYSLKIVKGDEEER